MAKKKLAYICAECGYESSGWLGKCPACGAWNSFAEVVSQKTNSSQSRSWLDTGKEAGQATIVNLGELTGQNQNRLETQIGELDRVLGGGLVKGSMVLLGGDPGIGKSTLLLQVLDKLNQNSNTLYISGEESPSQIKLRADRIGCSAGKVRVFTGVEFADIAQVLRAEKPDFAVIDSIQTIYISELSAAPGSVTQIREATAGLLRLAKEMNIAMILVGHVTKEGGIAGPRVLEHMVDAVLYFEGEKSSQFRILRAVKNRFGTTDEIGMFEMTGAGLVSVDNPGQALLLGRPLDVPGSCVTSCLEGSRSILIEVQALVNPSDFSQPIRNSQAIDRLRLNMLLAILHKSCGVNTGAYDAYVNVTGGLKVTETAADLAIVAALVSSIENKAIDPGMIIMGELGLAGEVRQLPAAEKRVQEAVRLGWRKFILPATCKRNFKRLALPENCELYYVSLLKEVLDILFF